MIPVALVTIFLSYALGRLCGIGDAERILAKKEVPGKVWRVVAVVIWCAFGWWRMEWTVVELVLSTSASFCALLYGQRIGRNERMCLNWQFLSTDNWYEGSALALFADINTPQQAHVHYYGMAESRYRVRVHQAGFVLAFLESLVTLSAFAGFLLLQP